jgi:hypothetical protein
VGEGLRFRVRGKTPETREMFRSGGGGSFSLFFREWWCHVETTRWAVLRPWADHLYQRSNSSYRPTEGLDTKWAQAGPYLFGSAGLNLLLSMF